MTSVLRELSGPRRVLNYAGFSSWPFVLFICVYMRLSLCFLKPECGAGNKLVSLQRQRGGLVSALAHHWYRPLYFSPPWLVLGILDLIAGIATPTEAASSVGVSQHDPPSSIQRKLDPLIMLRVLVTGPSGTDFFCSVPLKAHMRTTRR